MAGGFLGVTPPKTEIPEDRERWDNKERDWACPAHDEIVAALEAGKVVEASNYYGIPFVWKEAAGVYRGTMLQYRAISEAPTFASADEAAAWFVDRYHATDG
jgi:hypothetical protein